MQTAINNEEEYEFYLARAYKLMQIDLLEDSKEFRELATIATMIEAYEKDVYSIFHRAKE